MQEKFEDERSVPRQVPLEIVDVLVALAPEILVRFSLGPFLVQPLLMDLFRARPVRGEFLQVHPGAGRDDELFNEFLFNHSDWMSWLCELDDTVVGSCDWIHEGGCRARTQKRTVTQSPAADVQLPKVEA